MSTPKVGNATVKQDQEQADYYVDPNEHQPMPDGDTEPAAAPQDFGDGYGDGECPKTHTSGA